MKTSKILMIACLAAFTMMSFSMQAGVDPNTSYTSKTVVHLTLLEAVQHPELVDAMYDQLNDDFLLSGMDKIYTQTLYHANVIWVITGTYNQWRLFFRTQASFATSVDID